MPQLLSYFFVFLNLKQDHPLSYLYKNLAEYLILQKCKILLIYMK